MGGFWTGAVWGLTGAGRVGAGPAAAGLAGGDAAASPVAIGRFGRADALTGEGGAGLMISTGLGAFGPGLGWAAFGLPGSDVSAFLTERIAFPCTGLVGDPWVGLDVC